MTTIYVANNGLEFTNKGDCEDYETYFLNIKTIEEAHKEKTYHENLKLEMKKWDLPNCFDAYIEEKQRVKDLWKNKTKYSMSEFYERLSVCSRRVTDAANNLKVCIDDFRRIKRIIQHLHIKILIFKGELFTMEQTDDMYNSEYNKFTYCKVGDKVHCKPYASLDIDMDGTVVDVSNCYVRIRLETPNNPKYANSVIRIPLCYVKDYITVLN